MRASPLPYPVLKVPPRDNVQSLSAAGLREMTKFGNARNLLRSRAVGPIEHSPQDSKLTIDRCVRSSQLLSTADVFIDPTVGNLKFA